jgi:hypothetical protein
VARRANPLKAYFRRNRSGRLIHKWMHYFDIYHSHFNRFRRRRITVVEFGVQNGGSLDMWRHYFGRKARIIGVDIDPRCKALERPGTEILIGDQEDRDFLRQLRDHVGPIDVLIEDGGHTMGQQIATFEELWPSIAPGGVFLIEDLHTSYWDEYGGGLRREGTFIEYAKLLIDQQNAWHVRNGDLTPDAFTRSIRGMHIYDSIIVFDKGVVAEPHHKRIGIESFPNS